VRPRQLPSLNSLEFVAELAGVDKCLNLPEQIRSNDPVKRENTLVIDLMRN
jgi:hypothetical protein